jgi:AcrR family transcriptional regulator
MKKATRHRIIDVAMSVFSMRGMHNTTMDDVAKASGFGRRTIYTYFKTREELFHEVITKERDVIISQLTAIVEMQLTTEEKMGKLIESHIKTIEKIVSKNETLRKEFIKRSDRIDFYRSAIDKHEKACIEDIIKAGNAENLYHESDIETTAGIILTSLKGMEKDFILDNFGSSSRDTLKLFTKIILKGIKNPL